MFRSVKCAACFTEQTAEQLVSNDGCIGCGEMLCMFCGCTEFNPCPDGCGWVLPFICSAELHSVIQAVAQVFGPDAGRSVAGVINVRALAA